MSELLFCTFYVFAKLVMKAVLSLADGGRENGTLCCSFIGALNYLFPWGQSTVIGKIVRAIVLTACCSFISTL